MALTPDFDTFAKAYEAGENQVVYTRLAADLDTPVSLMLKLTGAQKDAFMLESVTGGEVRGRYSIIGMKPDLVWRCRGELAELNRDARFDADAFTPLDGNPLDRLRDIIAESRINLPDDLPQAAAGLFGYLGYDMIRLVEHLPDVNPDPLGLPDALMLRPSVIAVLDGVKGEVTVVSPAWVSEGQTAKAAYAQAAERVMDAVRDLERAMPAESRDLGDAHEVAPPVSNFTKDGYMAAVEKAKDYIRAGDIFQVVLSQRFDLELGAEPFDVYRVLRQVNPSPYMYFLRTEGVTLVGSSPEPMVQLRGRTVISRPIAGTRRRGVDDEHDRRLAAELIEHPKERAEHVMLVDLARNDVGRVAEFGTVRPDEFMTLERYSHVMHLTSQVSGTLRDGLGPIDVLRATLPAGTVSGAPKVRAMEIIDALEPVKRGPYAGVVGYLDWSGNLDTAICIRTMFVRADGVTASLQAGAGVVADSVPEDEDLECHNKAAALLAAIPAARRMSSR